MFRCYIFQVSWVRRKGDELNLITFGRHTYSSDSRYSLEYIAPNDWQLLIQFANERDEGHYECQISSHPPLVLLVYLTVVGKWQNKNRKKNDQAFYFCKLQLRDTRNARIENTGVVWQWEHSKAFQHCCVSKFSRQRFLKWFRATVYFFGQFCTLDTREIRASCRVVSHQIYCRDSIKITLSSFRWIAYFQHYFRCLCFGHSYLQVHSVFGLFVCTTRVCTASPL